MYSGPDGLESTGPLARPTMPSLLACLLALIFAWAAVAKLVRFGAWTAALSGYDLPHPLGSSARYGAPALEALVAALLVLGAVRPGAVLALALTIVFGAAILRARSRLGSRLPCGCFGGRGAHDYRGMLALDVALALAAATVLASGEAAAPARLDPAIAAPGLLVVAGIALAAWVTRQAMTAMRP